MFYIFYISVCGRTIQHSGTGRIESPGYSETNGTYPNSMQCIWVVENEERTNSSIVFTFDEDFDVETHGECYFDFIEIREGTL